VPFYSYRGSYVALLVSMSLLYVMEWRFARGRGIRMNWWETFWRPVVAAAVMCLALAAASDYNLIAKILLGAGVYVVALVFAGAFGAADRRLLWEMVKWREPSRSTE